MILAAVHLGELNTFGARIAADWHRTGEGVAIYLALGLVTLVAILWALCFRKRPPHLASDPRFCQGSVASKRRRRRRGHPHRNPTLAETRGLPPVRAEKSSSLES